MKALGTIAVVMIIGSYLIATNYSPNQVKGRNQHFCLLNEKINRHSPLI